MRVDLVRDKAKAIPEASLSEETTVLRVWHCGYRTLQPIRRLTSLRELYIAGYPDASFDPIAPLENLEILQILHFPRVRSLESLRALLKLQTLTLESLPSWDASSRRLTVESLAPLAALPSLRLLRLLGVVPASRTLNELQASTSLQVARFHGYTKAERERFFQCTRVQAEAT